MTTINPAEWVTAAEAARLLGISHQRVHQLTERGALAAVRPWPLVTLVSVESIESRRNR
jgi:hypothetical protein